MSNLTSVERGTFKGRPATAVIEILSDERGFGVLCAVYDGHIYTSRDYEYKKPLWSNGVSVEEGEDPQLVGFDMKWFTHPETIWADLGTREFKPQLN